VLTSILVGLTKSNRLVNLLL